MVHGVEKVHAKIEEEYTVKRFSNINSRKKLIKIVTYE